MTRKITKAVFALATTALALALIVVVSLGAWLLTGPKQLDKLKPYIESSLNPEGSPYRVLVGDIVVSWEDWTQPVDFLLKDVRIRSHDESARLMKLSEVAVGLHMPSLLRFKLVPESVVLRRPRMRFYRDADNELYVGIGKDDSERVPLRQLLAGFGGEEEEGSALIGNIRFIGIQNARILFGKDGEYRLLDAEDANLRIRREGEDVRALLDISFLYGEGKSGYIRGDMLFSDDPDVNMLLAKFELRDFSPHMLAHLYPAMPELASLELPLTGDVDVAMNQAGEVTLIDCRLQGREGIFRHEEHFAEPLTIRDARLEGQMRDNLQEFILKKAELDFGGATLAASGSARHYPEGWTAEVVAEARNMPVNDLYKYWPKTLSPVSYQWVTTHIREGIVPRAEAKLHIREEDLGQPFPESALAVTIAAEGVQVEYLDGHPKVQDVKGLVRFNGKGMTITSQEGRMLTGAILKDARLEIPDLTASPTPMHIRLAVEAPAKDVAAYIGIPELNFAEPLGLDPETASGSAEGTLTFDFVLPHADSEDKNPHLSFLIDAEVKDGAQPGFMGGKALSAANGKLVITEKELKYNGMMSISEAPLEVALTHRFQTKEAYPTDYTAKGVMNVSQLGAFGVPQWPFLKGNVALDAQIRQGPAGHVIKAKADLAALEADVPMTGLAKKAGVPATLLLDITTSEDALKLDSFSLTGNGIQLNGAAQLAGDFSTLQRLQLDRIEYGDNNFSLSVAQKGENAYSIRAKGASLDVSPLFQRDDSAKAAEKEKEKEKQKQKFALDVDAAFDWVVFGKERELRRVKLLADCRPDYCESVDAQGVTGQNNHFAYVIKRGEDGVRRLSFSAQNAGSFLKAVNLYDNMHGGAGTVLGVFDDAAKDKPFKGKLSITEHTISNAPVLAKIASLLSLSGIGDALQGKGIAFRELVSEVGYADGLLTFSKGRAYGPALGITLEEGVVDIDSSELRMNGTVVPSYTLNTVLGNIPLIGEALSGGKGEGVFAATYTVEGKYPDAVDVNVNPLSMLAPGFLRNVFGGVADTVAPQDKLPKEQEKAKEAEKAQTQQAADPQAEAAPAGKAQEKAQEDAQKNVQEDVQADMQKNAPGDALSDAAAPPQTPAAEQPALPQPVPQPGQ